VSDDVLRIVHLYPEELGVSGDRGNVTTLVERARRAGITSEVIEYRMGDAVPTVADVVVLGHGPLSGVRAVSADAWRLRDAFEGFAQSGVPVVAVGGGLELLTRGVVTVDGETVEGVGFFDALMRRGAPRRTNYFQVTTNYGGDDLTLFGFEDHAAHLELGPDARAFATVVHGGGNGSDGAEGVVRGASFGTQLKGPLLPLNPALTDRILRTALSRRSISYSVSDAHAKLDQYAAASQRVIADNLERSFKAM
jgi:CobQ-like glutamine amidotransferase family enzyme